MKAKQKRQYSQTSSSSQSSSSSHISSKKSRSRSKSPKLRELQNQQLPPKFNKEQMLLRRKETRYTSQSLQELNSFWGFASPYNIHEIEQEEFKEFKANDEDEFNKWNEARQLKAKESEERKRKERIYIQQQEQLLQEQQQQQYQGDSTKSGQNQTKHAIKEAMAEEEYFCGPQPLKIDSMQNQKQGYGGQLLPGEGKAIASYISEGKRIPRRGEIGLTSDEIESFEKIGFVMSGSRHSVMNAVRQRKEAQIYTFEEGRALHAFNLEKKLLQEYKTIEILKNQLKTHQESGEQ